RAGRARPDRRRARVVPRESARAGRPRAGARCRPRDRGAEPLRDVLHEHRRRRGRADRRGRLAVGRRPPGHVPHERGGEVRAGRVAAGRPAAGARALLGERSGRRGERPRGLAGRAGGAAGRGLPGLRPLDRRRDVRRRGARDRGRDRDLAPARAGPMDLRQGEPAVHEGAAGGGVMARVVAVNAHPEVTFEHELEALTPIGVAIERLRVGSDEELLAAAADADVVVPMGYRLSAAAVAGLVHCRHIPSGGIGVDHIDVEAATAHGILVTNMADTFVEEVANHTWMLLLLVARRGLWLHGMATSGRWAEALDQLFPVQRLAMPRVTGQTLGVVAFDPYVADDVFAAHGVERVSVDEVFRCGDVVSCHLPWTAETTRMIGERYFRLMKPSAIFLNTGRGKVVDERALIRALEEGRIAGAGLDVLEQEPPDPDNPLLRMPNVAITP